MLNETSVRGVLLTNGAVFYAKITDVGSSYSMQDPLAFRMEDRQGQQVLVPQPFLPTASDEPNVIDKIHVMTTFVPVPEIANAYAEITRTIVTPPKQGLILP